MTPLGAGCSIYSHNEISVRALNISPRGKGGFAHIPHQQCAVTRLIMAIFHPLSSHMCRQSQITGWLKGEEAVECQYQMTMAGPLKTMGSLWMTLSILTITSEPCKP